jgi:hypothetical protein
MNQVVIFFIAIFSGLLVVGTAKNFWTRFAVMCLVSILVVGILAYIVWVIINVVQFSAF